MPHRARAAARAGAALAVAAACIMRAEADTRVAPSATQAPAAALLDSAAVVRAAERLGKISDRVHVVTIGTSAGGRPIPMIIVTAPGESADEWQRRARRISGPSVRFNTIVRREVDAASIDDLLPTTRLPLLFAGASWGHEAAQVEGLLAAADHFAADMSPQTDELLHRIVLLIVPVMNPDGRDRAIAEWARTPLSNGDAAVANQNGFMLNRDFIHQTQPESRAILAVTREWRPVVGIDLHEDVNRLGVAMPDVAFVPPYMPGFDVEEEPALRKAIVRVGDAIAARWRAAGYTIVHDPNGDRRWVPMPPRGSGELNPVAGSSGRLDFLWNIHSIVGLITESARTPGTQRWEDRVAQKKLAVVATAEAVAADPKFFASTAYANRAAAASSGGHDFIAIAHAQQPGADRAELLRLLREHDVLVYRAANQSYDVVPFAQPEAPFVRHALLAERSKLNDLPAALGVQIRRSSELPRGTKDALSTAALTLYDRPPQTWPKHPAAARADRRPRVAVYSGQGIDRAAAGELTFVLKAAGLSAIELSADDVRRGAFQNATVVIVGDGAPKEIVDGWDLSVATRRAPWQPAEPSRGIGREGETALASYVRAGGRIITLGRSVGLAIPSLVPGTLPAVRPGIGEVRLEVTTAGQGLFAGVPREADIAHAFLSAPPGGPDGGYLLAASAPVQVLAWYAGADDRPAEQSFADVAPLARSSNHAAIIAADIGTGRLVAFGFSPVFRAQWRATFPLLFNALAQ
jgi:hypothetical protein